MRALPLILHVGQDWDSGENTFLRDQYDKAQGQNGKG